MMLPAMMFISIHLMFLLIEKVMREEVEKQDFNTSHVSINRDAETRVF